MKSKRITSYGERHEYVVVNGKRHYVVHPKKPKTTRRKTTSRRIKR